MQRMRVGEWLNDELVNAYLGLVARAANALAEPSAPATHGQPREQQQQQRQRVHAMSTYLLPKLLARGEYEYEAVSRWTKRVDLRACELVLFPINVDQNHWVLGVAHMRERRLEIWDSLHGRHNACLKAIRRYLSDELLRKHGERVEPRAWQVSHHEGGPRQRNGYDCGMFVCATARCLMLGVPVDLMQEQVAQVRQRVVFELMQDEIKLRACERAATRGGESLSRTDRQQTEVRAGGYC
jgi:sentrin-specific protease 1